MKQRLSVSILSLILFAAFAIGGCASHKTSEAVPQGTAGEVIGEATGGTSGGASGGGGMPNPVDVDVSEYASIFQTASIILREQGFSISHEDYRGGTLASKPQIAPSIPEVWRRHRVTARQAWGSTLNKQRRVVTIEMVPDKNEPAQNPQTYQLHVQVMLEQQHSPRRQLTGSAAGHRIMSSLTDTPTQLTQRGITDSYWQAIGHDVPMEQRLIRSIVKRSLAIQLGDDKPLDPTPQTDPTNQPPLDNLEKP